LHSSFQAMLAEAKEKPKDVVFVVGERARGKAARRLRKKQNQLLRESAGLADPEQYELHHAMRIAAKHLRYTLELARPIYPGALADADEVIRKLQTLLGEIHDCDVWVASFEEFAQREAGEIQLTFGTPQPFERLRPGLDCLCQERRARRRQVFDELAAYWQELKVREIWDRLENVLEWDAHKSGQPVDQAQARNHAKVGGVVRDQSEVVNPGGCGNHQIHGADFNTGAP
jgi:hypothetical protein